MTIGVLRALQRSGMRVPDDIALVGYDDLDFGDVLQPALTVMAQPVSEIASTAVNLLIRRITGKARTMDPQRVQIATTFIHRESCGCALKGLTDTMVVTSQRRAGRPLGASPL
jgi:LacI family transcriptional regulator